MPYMTCQDEQVGPVSFPEAYKSDIFWSGFSFHPSHLGEDTAQDYKNNSLITMTSVRGENVFYNVGKLLKLIS